MTLIVAAPKTQPMIAHDLSQRFTRLRQDRQPAQDGPQPVLFANVIRPGTKTFFPANRAESCIHQVPKELPPCRRFVKASAQLMCDSINGCAGRHGPSRAGKSGAVTRNTVLR